MSIPPEKSLLRAAARRLLRQADDAARDGRWKQVEACVQELLAVDSGPATRLTFAEFLASYGRWGSAIRQAHAALVEWQQSGETLFAGVASHTLARFYRRAGDFQQAHVFQQLALAWCDSFETSSLLELAIDALVEDNFALASQLAEECLHTAEEADDQELIARSLGVMANIELLGDGEPLAALQYVREAQLFHRRIGSISGRIANWLTAAAAYAALHRFAAEARALRRAEQLQVEETGQLSAAVVREHRRSSVTRVQLRNFDVSRN